MMRLGAGAAASYLMMACGELSAIYPFHDRFGTDTGSRIMSRTHAVRS